MAAAKLFASIFAVIFVAELPDKTALASLVLATRHRPLPVLLGAAAALAIQSLVAVLAGSLLALLPARAVHIGSGVLFLVSAVVMWRKHDEEAAVGKDEGQVGLWKAFTMSFMVVFVAEWGDLTQIATASFAARYKQPVLVFGAATAALWAVATVAVIAGNRAGHLLNPRVTQRIAAGLFALVGVLLIAGIL
ncbi:MAG TPA: TMEM165/GDT1 family protein [Polyangia bacterium]|jgi:putative Ca2+/H+ antiporter (TMEM165/GDT1 family)|nr:TMEM165/GDT1 family protein [Polyangia bacterium]